MRIGQKGSLPKPLLPEGWPRPRGYSYGFSARGTIVVLSGMVGWNREGLFESDDFVAQAKQALLNILEVLEVAGGRREHLVRLTWYVTDMREYLDRMEDLGEAYRSVMGNHYPAMSVVEVVRLVDERAKVEIEATAVISDFGKEGEDSLGTNGDPGVPERELRSARGSAKACGKAP